MSDPGEFPVTAAVFLSVLAMSIVYAIAHSDTNTRLKYEACIQHYTPDECK